LFSAEIRWFFETFHDGRLEADVETWFRERSLGSLHEEDRMDSYGASEWLLGDPGSRSHCRLLPLIDATSAASVQDDSDTSISGTSAWSGGPVPPS